MPIGTSTRERRGRPRRDRAGRRCRGDRGAVIVEAAFVAPVFLVLLFGVLEFGLAYGRYLSLSNLVTVGARQESIRGNEMTADWETLKAIKNAKNLVDMGQVRQVVIYKASGPNSAVPANCKTASRNVGGFTTPGVGSCNRFTASEWNATNGSTWDCSSTQLQNYCPAYRKVTISGPPDYVGVWVEMNHSYLTGLFGASVTLSDSMITRLEPQKLS